MKYWIGRMMPIAGAVILSAIAAEQMARQMAKPEFGVGPIWSVGIAPAARYDHLRYCLSAVALLAALISGMVSLLGVAAAWFAGWRGLRSRVDLLTSFKRVVAWMPAILNTQLAAAAMSVTLIAVSAALGAILWGGSGGVSGLAAFRLIAILVMLVIGVGRLTYDVIYQLDRALLPTTPPVMSVPGQIITEKEAPGLWALVRGLASQERAPAPDQIVVGMAPTTYVTARALQIMPARATTRGRVLFLSLAPLLAMSRRETSAIISHELAHFAGDDVVFSEKFTPLYVAMGEAAKAIMAGRTARQRVWLWPCAGIVTMMLDRFVRAERHWRRIREIEADRAAMAATDAMATASALLRFGLAAEAAGEAMTKLARSHALSLPVDLTAALRAAFAQCDRAKARARLSSRQPHPIDTHPLLSARLAAINVPADEALLDIAARPLGDSEVADALALFADWPATAKAVVAPVIEAMQKQLIEQRGQIEQAAANIPEGEVTIFDRFHAASQLIAVAGLVTIMAGTAALAYVVSAKQDAYRLGMAPVAGAAMMALGAGCLYSAYRRWWSAKRPALIVDKSDVRVRGLSPIAWADIHHWSVRWGNANGRPITIILHVNDTCIRQIFASTGIVVDHARDIVQIKNIRPRDWTGQRLFDIINRYGRGSDALRLLADREAIQSVSGRGAR